MTSNDSNQNIILKNFKNGLDQYKKKVKNAKENLSTKQKLDSILISDKENQKEKLINNEELAWGQFDKLEKAKRNAFEMESISIDVAKELNDQTDKLKGVKGKLIDMNSEISSSNSLISRMLRREYRNKIVIMMFMIALVLIFLTIIYIKLFGAPSEPPKMPIGGEVSAGSDNSGIASGNNKRFLESFLN
jgi:predicted RND superfamily exporter protein